MERGTGNAEPPTDLSGQAKALLSSSGRVLVMTGAGISAESGVPTFRGPGGLWREYRPEDLATPEAFARDPRLVWEWYAWRREKVAACTPNAGHFALARWMLGRRGVTLVTQNVDGLHEAAARQLDPADPRAALPARLHGSIARVRCAGCAYASDSLEPVDAASVATLPRCPNCGALLRPDVVWFGEFLPREAVAVAERAAWSADACLAVGTAGAVYPAADLVHTVYRRGRPVIVVDPGPTAFDDVAVVKLIGKAGEVLPAVLD